MLSKEDLKKIEFSFNEEIIKTKALTEKVTLLSFKSQKIILKEVNKKALNIYEYLISVNFQGALLPIKKFNLSKRLYYVFNYLETYDIPKEKNIIMAFDVLKELQAKTMFLVKLSDKEFKYFYRIYKKLDRLFQTFEMFVRESEARANKTDFDWVILSKCAVFIDLKQEMYQLQRKIHKYIDNKGSAYYCLNHGNLSLEHFIQNKLCSFENAYIGIFVSDLARFFVSIDHYGQTNFKLFSDYLESFNNEFYYTYFKFLVLYLYMLNLEFDTVNWQASMTRYIQIARKVTLFLRYFSKN